MSTTTKIFLGVVFLMLGCVIYLLFRSKTLNIYQWCLSLGLSNKVDYARAFVHDWNMPDLIIFSLPDGLYCTAYILIMDAIWQDNNNLIKHFIISLVPAITIISEVLQYLGVVKGTYDFFDLLLYAVPIIAYYTYKYYSFKFNKLKIKRL